MNAYDDRKNFFAALWLVNVEQANFVGLGLSNVEKAFYVGRNFKVRIAPRVVRAHCLALSFCKIENFFLCHFVKFLFLL